jgi:hypothetical protein
MKRVAISLLVAAGLASSSAFAADMPVKAPPVVAPPPWDVVVTAALMTDYNFRGITQSDHKPSTQGGFEWRYNFNPNLQGYVGLSGESIDFPNRAAAEIDGYGGIRPTFGKLATDFGIWYYWYPGGQTFNGAVVPTDCANAFTAISPATCNLAKADASFVEFYAKGTYTFNDQWAAGLQEWYSPSVSNTGADGWFTTGNVTFTAPSSWFPANSGIGGYASADLGYWALGTSDAFYGFTPYKSYATWDVGVGWTYKVLTLDLRYYDTNLNKGDCNAFTSDFTASGTGNVTTANPGGLGSNWCGAAFIAKLSASLDFNSNLK